MERAAQREAREEISPDVKLVALLGIYSNSARDPRGLTVTAVYVATATATPKADDDARNLGIFTLDELPSPLAFDHDPVLADFRQFRESGLVAPLR